ncbi:NADH-quinone oxidoreductase subunit NuoE [candidate division NPL-UPA2 bacterium Unc8]|uniref:NADH-quinone oxidoreductase subunit NuoE n=1 Tax=candidate division NPL-UPA2 bacterium Unc8 TaxID=1980939 RepID=A0A399FXH7_UNCN2|nr:NADH-quinone oxidoreductase subunit E [Bacillota bacterium]MBT9138473.1 NADH-quinone oxidoreductase subunit E [Bacillota bacterium]MBT9146377.1 NADH-quinone oxidoreductase subunit E [Bacillota bacterium]RII00176.1 MAG: NADH-quinone oxidoreductase subunit NuoE [candidate division NPL-UPA2 bacterium Unc8]
MREAIKQFTKSRENLIPILQEIQKAEKYLPPEAIYEVSRFLNLSENEIYSIATFYAQFRFARPGEHIIKICLGTACHVRGGINILESIERKLNVQAGGTTKDGKFSLERVACVGCCALAPVVIVDEDVHSKMTMKKVETFLGPLLTGSKKKVKMKKINDF